MSEPAGRVCEDPARHRRREGTPGGGAVAGYVSLPSFLSYNKKEGRPPGRDPADVRSYTGKPSRKGSPVRATCGKRFPRQVRLSKPGGSARNSPPVAALLGGSDGLFTTTEPLRTGSRCSSVGKPTPSALNRSTQISVKARCQIKARSEPPSSAAAGGEVRRGCLSRRSRRVPRRPPAASSAGQSSAQADDRFGRVAFFAYFLGEARK